VGLVPLRLRALALTRSRASAGDAAASTLPPLRRRPGT
jgi:hypothetical protein